MVILDMDDYNRKTDTVSADTSKFQFPDDLPESL